MLKDRQQTSAAAGPTNLCFIVFLEDKPTWLPGRRASVVSPVHFTVVLISAAHFALRAAAQQTDRQHQPPHDSLKHTAAHQLCLLSFSQHI